MESVKGKYQIEETFKVSGRGIMFSGKILGGDLDIGDSIVFKYSNEPHQRVIIGIDNGSAHRENGKIGLFIECSDEDEINVLSNWNLRNTIATIRNKK